MEMPVVTPRLNLVTLPHDILLVILRSVDSFQTLLQLLSTSRVFAQLFQAHSTVLIPYLVRKLYCKEAVELIELLRPNANAASELSRGFFTEISDGSFCLEGKRQLSPTPGTLGIPEVEWLQWNKGFAEGWVDYLVGVRRSSNLAKIKYLMTQGRGARATQLGYYEYPSEDELERMRRAIYNVVRLALQFHAHSVVEDDDTAATTTNTEEAPATPASPAPQEDEDGDTPMDGSAAGTPPPTTAPPPPVVRELDIDGDDEDTTPPPKALAINFDPPQPAVRRRAFPMFYDYTLAMSIPTEQFAEALCVAQDLRMQWEAARVLCSDAAPHQASPAVGAAALKYMFRYRCTDSKKLEDDEYLDTLYVVIEKGLKDAIWDKGRVGVEALKEIAINKLPKAEYETKVVRTYDGLGNLVKKRMIVLTELGLDVLGLNMDEVTMGEDFSDDEDGDMDLDDDDDGWDDEDDDDDEDEDDGHDYLFYGGQSGSGEGWSDEDDDDSGDDDEDWDSDEY